MPPVTESILYDAFISYSHAADKKVAAALQSVAQRLGKPWYRRRALRLFRDDTSLAASPALWSAIETALRRSRFFILLASTESAASPWVEKEVACWLGHHGADRILIGLTAGKLEWDNDTAAMRVEAAPALPPSLQVHLTSEPRWIDLRPFRTEVFANDTGFRAAAAEFAAVLHGRLKEDLLSEEVQQQRRALRLAGATMAALILLLALAGVGWSVAQAQRDLAVTQRKTAERNLAAAEAAAAGLVFDLAQGLRTHQGMPPDLVQSLLTSADDVLTKLQANTSDDPRIVSLHATAQLEIGETDEKQGAWDQALAIYRDGRSELEMLAAQGKATLDSQRNLAITDGRIGKLLSLRGDFKDANAALSAGQEIRVRLAATDPSDSDAQLLLARGLQDMGDVHLAQGDVAAAQASYQAELAIIGRLAKASPSNIAAREALADAHKSMGNALAAQPNPAGALVEYRQENAIDAQLAAQNPDNTDIQRFLFGSLHDLGDARAASQDVSGAIAAYRSAQRVLEVLAVSAPNDQGLSLVLAQLHITVGDILTTRKDIKDAALDYDVASSILESLAAANPTDTELQVSLANARLKCGLADLMLNDADHADLSLRSALAIADRLVQQDSTDTAFLHLRYLSHYALGTALIAAHALPEAQQQAEAALVDAHSRDAAHSTGETRLEVMRAQQLVAMAQLPP